MNIYFALCLIGILAPSLLFIGGWLAEQNQKYRKIETKGRKNAHQNST